MRRFHWLAVAVVTFSLVSLNQAGFAADSDSPKLERFSVDQLDKDVSPCQDFFQYACGKWIKDNPIPPDQAAWGTFNSLAIWNISAVHDTLELAAKDTSNRTPVEKMVGDYYGSCMDTATINKLGLKPAQAMLDRIAQMKDKSAMPGVIADIHLAIRPANLNFIEAQYQGVLFGIYSSPDFDDARLTLATLDQSGMGMPGREFYLKDDEKSKQIRDAYVKYISHLLQLGGTLAAQADTGAQAVLRIETALAQAAMDIVMRRDPKNLNNKMTLAQVQALTPSFNWKQYLQAMQAPSSSPFIVTSPEFFRGMEKLLTSESLANWQAYLRYSTLRNFANSLPDAFVEANFDFFGKQLSGSKQIQPRWRRCSFYADNDLGEAVGQAYVARYFTPESKERMLEMVHGIETALADDINSASWMSPGTKKLALVKLKAQVDKIGYPDKWIDYSPVEIKRDDFLGNVERASAFEMHRRLSLVGKPTDRTLWGMTPPTVNAYEDTQTNTINFPAGILQPPFFDPKAPDAVNYGAIGAVIGHEITHGYDDQGRKFDANGNLKDWWTKEDAANYDQRDACITDEYTQDIPEAGVKQNGKLSAGEDTADNGGIHLTLAALAEKLKSEGKTLDSPAGNGLTEAQTFFGAYATVWCGELRPEAARTAVLTQGHSLNRYRVNNVVSNVGEFARAFQCKPGQPMVRENACRVW